MNAYNRIIYIYIHATPTLGFSPTFCAAKFFRDYSSVSQVKKESIDRNEYTDKNLGYIDTSKKIIRRPCCNTSNDRIHYPFQLKCETVVGRSCIRCECIR